MPKKQTNHFRTLVVTGLAVLVTFTTGKAITAQLTSSSGQFVVKRGSILEVVPLHSLQKPQISWVLSRDETFVEAKTVKLFRTRFIESGVYKLDTEIKEIDDSSRSRGNIRIDIPEKTPEKQNPNKEETIATVHPRPNDDGQIIISSNVSVVLLSPLESIQEPIILDLDDTIDEDGDGDELNDNGARGTYFSKKGTPIALWFSDPSGVHTLTLSTKNARGIIQKQTVTVMDKRSSEQMQKQQIEKSSIVSEDLSKGRFAFYIEEKFNMPTVTKWDFGDGTQSLLDAPVHTFTNSGSFRITAEIIDIRSGDVLKEASKTIKVGSSSKPYIEKDDDDEEKKDDKPSEMGGIVKLILKILGIGLLALLIGGGLVFSISKVAKRSPSIEDKLAQAEEKLSGKGGEGKEKADVMEIKDEEPEKAEASKKIEEAEVVDTGKDKKEKKDTKESKDEAAAAIPPATSSGQASSQPAPTRPAESAGRSGKTQPEAPTPASTPPPKIERGPAPSWLQPSGSTQPAASTPPPAKTPTEGTEPSRSAPQPAPSPAPSPTPPPSAPSQPQGKTPDWLQPSSATPEPSKPTPLPTDLSAEARSAKVEAPRSGAKEGAPEPKPQEPKQNKAPKQSGSDLSPSQDVASKKPESNSDIAKGEGPMPDWLKPNNNSNNSTSASTPKPAPAPAPKPAPSPTPPPSKSAENKGVMPSWLQAPANNQIQTKQDNNQKPPPYKQKNNDDNTVAYLKAEGISASKPADQNHKNNNNNGNSNNRNRNGKNGGNNNRPRPSKNQNNQKNGPKPPMNENNKPAQNA